MPIFYNFQQDLQEKRVVIDPASSGESGETCLQAHLQTVKSTSYSSQTKWGRGSDMRGSGMGKKRASRRAFRSIHSFFMFLH